MRTLYVGALLTCLALPGLAVDRAQLDARLDKLRVSFEVMQAKPEKRIPPQVLRDAQGIVLLDRTKAGFIFAYQGGNGVALARNPFTGQWSAPAFFSASEASLGFQIGGQQTFMVILLMNTNSARWLIEPRFDFGGMAGGTAGNVSGGKEGNVSSSERLELIYTDSQGLYGGAAIKGASISPDSNANVAYYGQYFTTKEILFDNKARPTPAATTLAQRIMECSRPTSPPSRP